MATQISSIAARQQAFSSSLVIGAVPIPASNTASGDAVDDSRRVDLRLLAIAALRALERDVVSARFIGNTTSGDSRRRRYSGACDHALSWGGSDQASVSASAASIDLQNAIPCPILAILFASSIVSEIIKAEIKRRRLTVGDLDESLLREANYRLPLLDAESATTINVNEHLPSEVHRLLRVAGRKAADVDNSFLVFSLSGRIYVHWRRSDWPTQISSVEDLDFFLETKEKKG